MKKLSKLLLLCLAVVCLSSFTPNFSLESFRNMNQEERKESLQEIFKIRKHVISQMEKEDYENCDAADMFFQFFFQLVLIDRDLLLNYKE